MVKFWKFLTVFGAVGGLVQGIGVEDAKAAAVSGGAQFKQHVAQKKWDNLREQLQGQQTRELREELRDVLRGADLETGLLAAIELSYAMALPKEVDPLDELWLETLVARGDNSLISSYLIARSKQGIEVPMGDAYLDRWLWEAGAGGGCDGNPGNDKPVGGSGEDPNDSGGFGDGTTGTSS